MTSLLVQRKLKHEEVICLAVMLYLVCVYCKRMCPYEFLTLRNWKECRVQSPYDCSSAYFLFDLIKNVFV